MDVTEAIRTRVEVREYEDEPVPAPVRRAVLEAARLAPSGHNSQHWRFVLVDGPALDDLAALSTTGDWVADADFAVVVFTDPERPYHRIDAGRAITHMQFAGWARGVGSCIYTGLDEAGTRAFLDAPDDLEVTAVVGFGYPDRSGRGRKDREPLSTVAFDGQFGVPYGPDRD